MLELEVKFNRKISIKEFDNQIIKLVNNFPKDKKILISLKDTKDYFIAIFKENPNTTTNKRWEWSGIYE
ncbi:hypothetical protein [Candidatus Pelagibacter sp. HIMB1746]|uniref:hypothetical protein n=1 Tax=Candidatus Pelagibacter sp. HIMB1746 TaxID=3413370 RepID=UPI003F8760C7